MTAEEIRKSIKWEEIYEAAKKVEFERDMDETGARGLWDLAWEKAGEVKAQNEAERLYNMMWYEIQVKEKGLEKNEMYQALLNAYEDDIKEIYYVIYVDETTCELYGIDQYGKEKVYKASNILGMTLFSSTEYLVW